MPYRHPTIQLLLTFFLVILPGIILAQYIDAEITITITESTYMPSKSDHKDMTTTTRVSQGRVSGQIFRSSVKRYIENPETRTQCPGDLCAVITGSSDYVVRDEADYSKILSKQQDPFYVKATSTSDGMRWVNKKNSDRQEKYVQTERFSASGENNVDGVSMNIIAYIAPSDQLAPLVPSYEIRLEGNKPFHRLREQAVGEGEWFRWDDEEEKLVPVNEPLNIDINGRLRVDPSRKDEDEIYEPLLIKNYKDLDEFMLDPSEKIFTIQASGKRHRQDYYSEYESKTEVVINLAPFGFMRKPTVTLNGCSEMGVGEEGVVTAKANKEGGTYTFWVEPQEIMSIESDGSSATLSGSTPGRGTLFVEYTHTDGKKAQASQVAACVQVESYNGGQAIPQIAFYDIDGKKQSGIITVPVTAMPTDAAEFVTFEPADPGVLSAFGVGTEVTLQGIITGKTTLQAKTKCGEPTGPAVEVEVVNCDDETIAALERMRQTAMENLQKANDELRRIAGNKEYEKAKEEIAGSLQEMMAKSALTIVTSGKSPTGAIETASDIAEAGAGISEMIASGSQKEFYENAIKTYVGKLGDKAAGAAIGVIDAQKAAQKFGDNWNQTMQYNREVRLALETFEKADKDLQKYIRLLQKCQGEKPEPLKKEAPMTEPKPETKKPESTKSKPAAKPTPNTEEPPTQEPQNDQSTPEQPAAEDEILIDPEFPSAPSLLVGLPYEPGDCGCDKYRALTASSKSFSEMQLGMENLQKCVDNFSSGPLNEYLNTLNGWKTISEDLETAFNSGAAEIEVATKKAIPIIDSLLVGTKAFDEAGKNFLDQLKACPESMNASMEVFDSVNKITVESLKVNY
ncbi:MAG: hypothetical protein U5K79_01715 [Cyclobacteriaceae bacterium]|nr:hypothetical protein [Cyclobacteriaceae bacterium]